MNTVRAYQTYQHYKGGLYLKLCDALHTETDEMMTVYVCVVRGAVFTRPKAMFDEMVQDGAYQGPRFIEVADGLSKDQAKEFLVTGGYDARQSA
jgi:hypothetical protein